MACGIKLMGLFMWSSDIVFVAAQCLCLVHRQQLYIKMFTATLNFRTFNLYLFAMQWSQ